MRNLHAESVVASLSAALATLSLRRDSVSDVAFLPPATVVNYGRKATAKKRNKSYAIRRNHGGRSC